MGIVFPQRGIVPRSKIMEKKQSSKNRWRFLHSLRFRLGAGLAAVTIVFGVALFFTTTIAYRSQTLKTYGEIAENYASAASTYLPAEKAKKIVEPNGDKSDEYLEVRDDLENWFALSDEVIKYLYVYQVVDMEKGGKGFRVIYDSDKEDGDSYGYVFPMNGEYELEGKSALADPDNKDDVGPFLYNGYWGWLISYYRPILDSDNKAICYIGVDVDFNAVIKDINRVGYSIIGIEGLLMIITLVGAILIVNFSIVKPINKLKEFNENFSSTKEIVDSSYLMRYSSNEFQSLYRSILFSQKTIVEDRKKLQEYSERMKELAFRDPLTGANSINAFLQKEQELDAAIANDTARFALVMIDMNGLKFVNDTYGHNRGNLALRTTSRAIAGCFIHSPLYRVGGDEFVVVLEGEDYENRDALLAKLREFEVSRDTTLEKPWAQVAISVGVKIFKPSLHHSVEQMLEEADKEMYEEKKSLSEKR